MMNDERKPRFPASARLGAGIVGLAMFASATFGFLSAHADNSGGPLNWRQIAVLAVFGVAGLLLAWMGVNAVRSMIRNPERIAPRQRRANMILWISFALGAVVGVALVLGDAKSLGSSMWQGPISPAVAILLALGTIVALPGLTWFWARSIDEHERKSTYVAAETALFVYMTMTPGWWLLWRGGLLSPPDQAAIFITTMIVYSAAWLYRKYS